MERRPDVAGCVVTAALLLLSSCGKVADPKPPFVRIPEAIHDLAATQSAYDIVLSWTNPAHNLDGSPTLDLDTVHIAINGRSAADLDATGPGKPQSLPLPAEDWLGDKKTFAVWVETTRHKMSDIATVQAKAVAVPGAVKNVQSVVDQYAISITWSPPDKGGDLVGTYYVQRTDRQGPPLATTETRFRDPAISLGKTYVYQIVAARQVDSKWITGEATAAISVLAIDHIAPQTPTGLAIVFSDTGSIVTWDANQELDLKGYVIYKNGTPVNAKIPQTQNSFVDPDYRPGTRYAVSAVDQFDNESPPSAPIS